MDRRSHWDNVYQAKASDAVSWFEAEPAVSLKLLHDGGLTRDSWVIDVGGGDSRLVDALLAQGLRCITVLDVSRVALARAATRLGPVGDVVTWLAADVTTDWPAPSVDFWHDRAVFHFLVADQDRIRYIKHLRSAVKRGGAVVIATFALDGPPTCSGLPVMRYAPQTLAAELGDEFALLDGLPAQHFTPWGTAQSFQYSRFKRV